MYTTPSTNAGEENSEVPTALRQRSSPVKASRAYRCSSVDLASGLPLYMVCAGRFTPPSLQCA